MDGFWPEGGSSNFQRLMDSMLRDLAFVFVYLNDILVASPSAEKYLVHLKQISRCLAEKGLIVKLARCQFG